MKRLIAFLTALYAFCNFAAIGDTNIVSAHDSAHWTWYGNYDAVAVFPSTHLSYEKVFMEFEIWCPDNGCSDWDYTTKISARLETGTDTTHSYDSNQVLTIDTFITYREVELGRYITPYAGNYGDDWHRTFRFDVTDFQSILKDSTIIRAFYDGWQDGWKFSTRFLFIEGTPTRNVIGFENLWTGRYNYGDLAHPIDESVAPMTVPVLAGSEFAKLRVVTTGHRFGGAENCAEFCVKNHEFHINGSKAFDQLLWKPDCGMNPEYPQAGTWLYDRAGWCPGEPVPGYQYDLSEYISGDSITIDYRFDDYTWDNVNPPSPSYYIGAAVVYYGPFNFQKDAALIDIISPTKAFEHSRYNPICGDPIVVIQNNGSEVLTAAAIKYGIEGEQENIFNWSGSLAPLEKDTVTLYKNADRSTLWSGANENSIFYAEIELTNDQYGQNNRRSSSISLPPLYPKDFILRFRTNGAPEETSVKVYYQDGTEVYSTPDVMESRETYDSTLSLAEGCYWMEVIDSGKDGVDFWANSDGRGKLEFRTDDSGSADLIAFDLDFGTALYYHFMVGYELNVEELESKGFMISPNPSNGIIYIHSKENTSSSTVEVYTTTGQKIFEAVNAFIGEGGYRIDLSDYKGQILFVRCGEESVPVILK